MQPLYGHTSPETAYVVEDYPYGRLRCQIKFWLETDARKGVRFCSQTINPKNGRVNAPKKSTYARLGGGMFLDEQGHCTWRGLSEYASPADILAFVQEFPGAYMGILKDFLSYAVPAMKGRAEGKIRLEFVINGQKQTRTEEELRAEQEKAQQDLILLQKARELIGS